MARTLLDEIEQGAHDDSADLPSLLRKCIALGGATGSDRLRDWASLELKGYGGEDELPDYRNVTAPLLLDGVSGYNRITGQQVPALMIPDFARDKVNDTVVFPQPIAELTALLRSARSKNESVVRIGPPRGSELVALINRDLAEADRQRFPDSSDLPPTQIVERIYWSVSTSSISRIVDVVRTTLVELVAEMRSVTPASEKTPSREAAEQAVDVAIYGKRNRVVVNQVAPDGVGAAAVGGTSSVGSSERQSRARTLMWWVVGLATIIAALAGVWALFIQ